MPYPSTPSQASFGASNMNKKYALTQAQVNAFANETNTISWTNITKLFANPIDGCISLNVFPFSVKDINSTWAGRADTPIKLLNITMEDSTGCLISPEAMPLLSVANDFTVNATFGNFLDYSPYSKIYLYMPYIGFVELDPDEVVGKTFHLYYAVDLVSGKCTAYLVRVHDSYVLTDTVILVREGVIGQQIQIAGGIGSQLSKSILTAGVGVAATAVAGIAGASGAAAATAASAGATGVANAAGWLASTTSTVINAGQIKVDKAGTNNANNALYGPQVAYLLYVYPDRQQPALYASTKGFPSGKATKLNQVTGFNAIESVHIEGISGITSDETDRLDRILKSGVIL